MFRNNQLALGRDAAVRSHLGVGVRVPGADSDSSGKKEAFRFLHFPVAVPAIIAFLTIAVLAAPAQANTVIRSVRAFHAAGSTLVDFTLDGKTFATVAATSTKVDITFAGARPAPDLAQHIDMNGSVGRMTVEGAKADGDSTSVSIALVVPMTGTLVESGDPDTIRLCLRPPSTTPPAVVSLVGADVESLDSGTKPESQVSTADGQDSHLYNIDAYNSDAASLFKSLAEQSKTNIVLLGTISSKVTVHFSQAPIDRAIDMLTKAAGLCYVDDGETYYVGSEKDIVAVYPNENPHYRTSERVYNCNYVDASALATSIIGVFDKDLLHVSIGAIERTTTLSGGSASQGVDQGGGSGSGSAGGSTPSGGGSSPSGPSAGGMVTGSSTPTGRESREVVLYGDSDVVDQAYALAQQLDRKRKQIKIDMELTDVSMGDLKQLGLQWQFPQFSVPTGSTGTEPSFEATLSAMEDANKAKLLAAPSITLLDGEQGYILIGQRISYPTLTGYSQASTPIFTIGQEEVGIYLQVHAQLTEDDEIMLSVYPQVSSITGYLNVNGGSYPQVSTREQQTTVRVHTGDKIVIGGLINDQDTKDFQSIPFLSKIPFFGNLFKYHNDNKSRDEVIMTITPQIVED